MEIFFSEKDVTELNSSMCKIVIQKQKNLKRIMNGE